MDRLDAPFFNFSLERWRVPRPQEDYDDSWLDKEMEEEQDERMKDVLIQVKKTMKTLDKETKKKYIFEQRKCIVEREQYVKDINTTQGFEVGEYPYLARNLFGSFITRYYYPSDTRIAMISFSCGHWYYLTFQANLRDHPPQIFQAKVYDEPHWVSPPIFIEFGRPKPSDDA